MGAVKSTIVTAKRVMSVAVAVRTIAPTVVVLVTQN
jgi:hypothetical protein